MKQLLTACVGLLVSLASYAQPSSSERDSVLKPIRGLFASMAAADTSQLRQCFTSSARMETAGGKKASLFVRPETIETFAKTIAGLKPGMADERIEISGFQSDGRIAQVWTPYHFYLEGKFSHCGINAFTLLHTPEGWKIQYILDTRYREGCTPDKKASN